MHDNNKGFMLFEMIIIIVLILILAAIAIPGLLRARISANEGSAAAVLRSTAAAQCNFEKSCSVDQDNDGTGEHGVFNEMTGATNRRGSVDGKRELPALTVSDLSMALITTRAGHAAKSGYFFKMWLPGAGSPVTDHDPAQGALSCLDYKVLEQDDAIQQQENRWICYAWPAIYRSSGVRAFVCDQSAEVYASANTAPDNQGYFNGTASQPNYDTAMGKRWGNPTPTMWQNICGGSNSPQEIVDPNHIWIPSSY